MVPITGNRSRPRHGAVFLHEQGTLQTYPHLVDFFLGDAVGNSGNFTLYRSKGKGSPIIGCSRVGEDCPAIVKGNMGGPNRITEPLFFPHLGEKSRAHAATKDINQTLGLIIIGMGRMDTVPSKGDLGLLGFLLNVCR